MGMGDDEQWDVRDRAVVVDLGFHLVNAGHFAVVLHFVECVIRDRETIVRPTRATNIISSAG
jgi:hypothetical protein